MPGTVVPVQRSAVGKRLNKLKTEYSQDEVPIERGFILELKKWQALCLDTEEHWLFPSPVTGRPYHADSMRNDYLVPTGLKLDLAGSGFTRSVTRTVRGWTRPEHPWAYSRNSYDTRTSQPRWTSTAMPRPWPSAKPIAQSCNASCKACQSRGLHSINKGNCEPVPLIGQFWTVAASAQLPVTL
jgi:hypothetical protein